MPLTVGWGHPILGCTQGPWVRDRIGVGQFSEHRAAPGVSPVVPGAPGTQGVRRLVPARRDGSDSAYPFRRKCHGPRDHLQQVSTLTRRGRPTIVGGECRLRDGLRGHDKRNINAENELPFEYTPQENSGNQFSDAAPTMGCVGWHGQSCLPVFIRSPTRASSRLPMPPINPRVVER